MKLKRNYREVIEKCVVLLTICWTTTAMAQSQQKKIVIDTWNKVDVAAYDKQDKNIQVVRYMFNGWNTFCIPFAMTEAQVETAFGTDCKVETLVGAEGTASDITVYFDNVKSKGIEANKPYIVYYSGESKYISVNATDVTLDASGEGSISFMVNDTKVSFNGTYTQTDGTDFYGIYAKYNAEAAFAPVTAGLNGFYPTRCYLSVNGKNNAKVTIKHSPTSINNIAADKAVDKNNRKYNVAGQQVNDSHKGVVIQNGKKYIAR